MSIVKGFHHIAIKAEDFETTLAFYQGLGLARRIGWGTDGNRAVMLDMGDGGCIEIFEGGKKRECTADEANEHWLHLALKTDNVEEAYNTALALGATPRTEPITVSPDGSAPRIEMQVAFVYGPDGEIVEFFKEI